MKVVFATETLALGINMPARSVVIEKLSKFTGEHHEFLTPGEYTQLAGRAGRRGIDDVGYVVVLWSPFVPFDQVAGPRLAAHVRADVVVPPRPTTWPRTWCSAIRRDEARHLLNLSFAQFHTDRDVVAVERDLELRRRQLAEAERAAVHPAGDVHEYRRCSRRSTRRAARPDGANGSDGFESLRPGDVLVVGQARRQGRRAEAGTGERSQQRVLALTQRQVARPPGAARLRRCRCAVAARSSCPGRTRRAARRSRRRWPRRCADCGSPTPSSRRAPTATSTSSKRPSLRTRSTAPPVRESRAAGRVAGRPDRARHRPARTARSRRAAIASPASSTGCSSVLRTWGYVDEWTLTDAGRLLTRLNSEGDLVVAEAIREGRLDGIDPGDDGRASCRASRSERRGPDSNEPMPPRALAEPEVARRSRALERVWRDLTGRARTTPPARDPRPDPGFTAAIYAWVQGDDLADVLEDEEMTGGDFVRNVKQTIDLLRQIAEVAPERRDRCDGPLGAADAVPAGRDRRVEHREGAGGVIRPGEEWGRPTGRTARRRGDRGRLRPRRRGPRPPRGARCASIPTRRRISLAPSASAATFDAARVGGPRVALASTCSGSREPSCGRTARTAAQ